MESGISVVVATYNRYELLQATLQSLLKQKYPVFEIIVVDDGSTDQTARLPVSDERIKIIHQPKNLGQVPARNIGIQNANFNLIAFTDDDCLAQPDWLARLAAGFTNPRIGFVYGQTIYVGPGVVGRFPERVIQNPNARWPMGNNVCYRRAVFAQAGGFNPEMEYYHNDDSEMAVRAVAHGFDHARVPDAIVIHQKTFWTARGLLKSARNPAVWVILKKRFPLYYRQFDPPIRGLVINPGDYLQILLMPVLLPILLLRFVWQGGTKFRTFFVKWPLYPFLRRFYIYREAIRQQTLML